MMEPYIGKVAFNLAILLIILATIPLPMLKIGSAELVADVIALAVSFVFLMIIIWDIRRQVKQALPKTI